MEIEETITTGLTINLSGTMIVAEGIFVTRMQVILIVQRISFFIGFLVGFVSKPIDYFLQSRLLSSTEFPILINYFLFEVVISLESILIVYSYILIFLL